MTEAIWVAIIGAIGVIIAPLLGFSRKKISPNQKVIRQSTKHLM